MDDLIYKLENPPTMSHVANERDLYSIMYAIMREAATELKKIKDKDNV